MRNFLGFILLICSFSVYFCQSKKEIKKEGLIAFNNGDFVSAKQHYLKLLEKGDKTWETYTILGDCELQTGDENQALEYYTKAQEKNPIYSGLYLRKATILRQQKKFDEAILNFRKMTITNPTNPQIYNMISSTYYEKGDYKQALSEIEQMVKLGGENLDSSYGRALSYLKLDKIKESCEELNKADKFDTNNENKVVDLMIAQHCSNYNR